MIGYRILKLEKFFKVTKPKQLNQLEWFEKLNDMIDKWEEENNQEFKL